MSRNILLPIKISDVQMLFGFGRIQTFDLIDWKGDTSDERFQRLIKSISALLGIPEETQISSTFLESRGERRSLNEAKLVLVGFGGVGKTSLVNRLVHRRVFNKQEETTEGIAISEWPLVLANGEGVHLHVWDFGGQEIMHSTHQFFLTTRSLYLLVLNGRQGREDADAEYWLNLIKSFGAESPVIIVLNKIHELPFDVNRRALQYKFPNISVFVATDCADRTRIKNLLRVINNEVARLPHLHDTFPPHGS